MHCKDYRDSNKFLKNEANLGKSGSRFRIKIMAKNVGLICTVVIEFNFYQPFTTV